MKKVNFQQSELTQSFAAHDHCSSIRSITVCGNYLASGGTDDRIIVYDLKTRKEHCMLTHHDSTVTSLQFTNNHTHLISGSADGVLAIVRVGNWQLEKVWPKAHNGAAILDIAVHSSGKLALTLGADCSLRTWNLIKGRQAYVVNLNSRSKDPKRLEKIIWSPDDVQFLLYGGNYTEIWSIETGGVLDIIEHEQKVISCVWLDEKRFLTGYEDGQMAKVEIVDDVVKKEPIKAHNSRLKALVKYNEWIVSASSDGEIKVWDQNLRQVASCNTGCRLTCLCAANVVKKEEQTETTVTEQQVVKEVKKTQKIPRVTVEVEDSDQETPIIKKKKKETKMKQKKKKKI